MISLKNNYILSILSCLFTIGFTRKSAVSRDSDDDFGNTGLKRLSSGYNSTQAQLESFYNEHGGPSAFPDHYRDAIEALLYGQDDVIRGNFSAANERIRLIFEKIPLNVDLWFEDFDIYGLNVGEPIAYYGLRMLDLIASVGDIATIGTLYMTTVVAECASVSRPTLPDFTPEIVDLSIDPNILKDSASLLHNSTDLFRRWVKVITEGYDVKLMVYTMTECTTVSYTDDEKVILSYPNTRQMIESVPAEIHNVTNFWWVIAPSGVPGDGQGFDRHFITGALDNFSDEDLPVFISDDKWFTRKIEHLGKGPYHIIENRLYHPQWFQHEFMHHLYNKWPEFGLEDSLHQWFDRKKWPEDFEGMWEPDYYTESITKRFLTAKPSLAVGLGVRSVKLASLGNISLDDVFGQYTRWPILNDWHIVTISKLNDSDLLWTNAAGVQWPLLKQNGMLLSDPNSAYGEHELLFKVVNGGVKGISFDGEFYEKLLNTFPPALAPTINHPVSVGSISLDDVFGQYTRWPILNDWHIVTILKVNDSDLLWTNAAGVQWPLLKQNEMLLSDPNSAYGEYELLFKVVDGGVKGIYFDGEFYEKKIITMPPVPTPTSKKHAKNKKVT